MFFFFLWWAPTDYEHARRAVEPAAVEDRPPLDAEVT